MTNSGQSDKLRCPSTIVLSVCQECGRTDRYGALKSGPGRHFNAGKLCAGKVVDVIYEPKKNAP